MYFYYKTFVQFCQAIYSQLELHAAIMQQLSSSVDGTLLYIREVFCELLEQRADITLVLTGGSLPLLTLHLFLKGIIYS